MADSDEEQQGWAAHAVEQRRAWLKLSYAERLQWLEDAKRFVALAHGVARQKRVTPVEDGET